MKNTDVLTLAEKYAKNMSENFNNYMIASCDWNILLSSLGGPYHNRTAESVSVDGQVYESKDGGCYAPVLYDKTEKKLIYTPIYYYIGHFSKFIKRGAKRLGVTKYSENLYFSAFCNPDGEIVAVALNPTESDMTVNLRLDGICTKTVLKAHSIATYIFS
jgi:glucosylceramidase